MFITFTIDTNQKKKLRFFKKRFDASTGWRKSIHVKKRNFWQKFFAWRRSLKDHHYKLDGQVAMF